MRSRKLFTESIKHFKKMVKSNNVYYIQFKDEKVYISEGHFVSVMPVAYYQKYILESVLGMPTYAGKDTIFSGKKGALKEHETTIDFAKIINDFTPTGTAKMSPMIFNEKGSDLMRAIIWNDTGKAAGTLINEVYYKISLEYSDGNYAYIDKKSPLLTTKCDNEFMFFVLPINYQDDSTFQEILDTLSYEAKVNSKKQSRKAA